MTAKRTSTTPRRRWTDETIERELRTQMAALGHFPSRAELVAAGLRSLWDAMRAAGDVEAWRTRMNGAQPDPSDQATAAQASDQATAAQASDQATAAQASDQATAVRASHEAIAARAYELYEQGAPGDHVEHWLAAERDLDASVQ